MEELTEKEVAMKAIKDSIKHWSYDILYQFNKGYHIKLNPFRSETRTLMQVATRLFPFIPVWKVPGTHSAYPQRVKYTAADCPLCITYVGDSTECPLNVVQSGKCCGADNTTWYKFYTTLDRKTAVSMIRKLAEVYFMVKHDRLS